MNEQNKQVIENILERIDIVELISEHVVLKKNGSNYFGLCPFHQEKSPSFSVNAVKQIFRCFGCGIGGNIFEFYKNFHKLSFPEALKELASRAGVNLISNFTLSPEQAKKEEFKKNLADIYQKTTEFYQWNLKQKTFGEAARKYLSERKISPEMLEKFAIGFSQNGWDSLYIYLQKHGFAENEIKDSGLVVVRPDGGCYDRFRNRIMFPIQDEKGKVIAFGGRTLESGQAKYINSPETEVYTKGKQLYALNFAKNKIRELDQVILVEGYLDVITCHQYGFENTVASLGTALTPDQAKKLLRFGKKVLVAYDADQAGKMAADRGTEVLEEVSRGTGISIKMLQVPSGKDPDEFLHSFGAEQFQNIIDQALPILEFKIEQILSEGDFSSPETKSSTIEKVLLIVNKIQDQLYLNELIKKIANWQNSEKKVAIREEDLRRKLKSLDFSQDKNKYQKKWENYPTKKPYQNDFRKNRKVGENEIDFGFQKKILSQKILANFEKVPGASQAEKGIIYFMIERKAAIGYIKKKLENIFFQDPINEKIKTTLYSLADVEQFPDWKALLNIFTDSSEQERITEIWENFENTDVSSDNILRDYLRMVRLNSLRVQRDELRSDIDRAGAGGHHEIARHLMETYTELLKIIKQLETEIFARN